MTGLSLSQSIEALVRNPYDEDALAAVRALAESQDADLLGEDPVRDIEMARAHADQRGDYLAIAALLELECTLVTEDPDFLVALYREHARVMRDELFEDGIALNTLRLLLEWLPDDPDTTDAIAYLEGLPEQWRGYADQNIEEANASDDPATRAALFAGAANLVWQYGGEGKETEVDELFQAATEADPSDLHAARQWAYSLRLRGLLGDAASVLYRLAQHAADSAVQLATYVQAGRDFLAGGEPDQAAMAFEQVLDFAPGHDEALPFLSGYFTEREEYDSVVAIYEEALRAKKGTEAEQVFLLQLAMIHWRVRSAPDEAEVYFARLRKLDPAHPGMLAFYREHFAEGPQNTKLLNILGDAQRSAGGGSEQKIELALEMARKAEANDQHERAIDAWKSVQRIEAKNEEAREALKRIYRRAEKWNALAEVLKQEADGTKDKERKLTLLRELVEVYRDHLRLDAMVASTYNQIAELAPNDGGAIDQLIATYEQMGRWNDLVNALGKKAETAEGDEKVELLMRAARLWIDRFSNFNKATEPLEQVLSIDTSNRDAIELLKDIYSRKRAWKQLFDVQLREVDLESDPFTRRQMRIELAKLAGEKLHKHAEALALWKDVVAEDPTVEGAVDALEKLGEREKDWDAVVIALENRIDAAGSDADRIKFLTKLGTVQGDQRKDPAAAADAWKRILRIEPKNGRALRTLRESFLAARDWAGLEEMYAEASDWEGLVDVLGSTADRAEDVDVKVELSFRAASIYEDRIGEPNRAFRAYERVLTADPKNARAAEKLAAIYESEEKWSRLSAVLEVLAEAAEDTGSRVTLLVRLRDLAEKRLADPAGAFRFATRAYREAPEDADVVIGLERAADLAGTHAELSALYTERLAVAAADEQLELRRRLASLAGEKLGRPDEAIVQLRAIVDSNPDDEDTVAALVRLYRAAGRHDDRAALLAARVERASSDDQKLELLGELASLEETDRGDLDAAAGHLRAMLSLDASNPVALEAIDRVLVKTGKYAELADVLVRRIDGDANDEERVALQVRLGDLRRERLADVRGAIEAYDAALQIDSGADGAAAGLAALEASQPDVAVDVGRLLEPYYERTGKGAELSAVLERRLAATTDDDERRTLRLRVAELASTVLGNPAGAYEALEAAFLDAPSDVDLWDRIAAAAEEAGRVEDLAKAFEIGLEAEGMAPEDAVELARRTAVLYDVSLGQPAAAEPHHRRVLAADASDETAFAAIKGLLQKAERWDDLQALYRTRIDASVDVDTKMELLRQVCFLFEDFLDDPERAIAAYQELLELDPSEEAPRRALDKLYRRTGKYRELLEILGQDLDATQGPKAVELTFEIGHIHETRLGEGEQAVDYYERVLEQNQSHLKSVEALERLLDNPATRQRVARILEPIHERSSAFAKLAKDLEVQLESADSAGERVELLMRLAGIREERLRDRDGAFAAIAGAVEADPTDESAREKLARLADQLRDHARRAEVLERAAEQADGSNRVDLYVEIAKLWDESVGDPAKAEAAYRRTIECDPDNADVVVPASRALERIHLATGNERELVADLRRQIAFEHDPSVKGPLLVRLADLLELSLEDHEGAIAVHRERLDLDSVDDAALAALERLYTRTAQHAELVEILRAREQVTDAPTEQRAFAMRVAELEETKLGRVEDAISTYADVVARFGQDTEALRALCRLHRAAERWQDLHDDYEALIESETDDAARADLRLAAADVLRTKLGDSERALEAYRDILESVPGHKGAIEALEDVLTGSDRAAAVTAARLLVPELRRAERFADLLSAYDVLAGSEEAPERLDALRQASLVAEHGANDLAQAFAFECRAAEQALSEPELPEVLARIDDLARQTGKYADQVEVLRRIIPDILDGEVQLATTMKVADVARRELKDLDLARDYYNRALENSPEHRPALDALDHLLVERGDHRDLLDTLRRKVEVGQSAEERAGNLLRIAELCERTLEDAQGAIDAYEQVLTEKPTDAAYAGLERLYAKTERHSDLAALFERMVDEKVGDARDVRHKLAQVRLQHLGDADAALEALKDNLVGGTHEPSLTLLEGLLADEALRAQAAAILEPVYTQQMNWSKVVPVIEARLSAETDEVERKAILRRLGQLHEDYREDLASAFDAYGRLFREDVRDEQVWDVLSRLARAQNKYDKLADLYQGALADIDVDDDQTAKLALATAQLYDEKVKSAEKAAPLYARALRSDPSNRACFESLEAAYKKTGQWAELVEVYREQADLASSDRDRVDLLQRLAGVELDQLGHVEEAVSAHRQVLDVAADDKLSVQALDGIFTSKERWQDLADLLRFRIDGAREVAERAELRNRLGGVLSSRLDDVDGAIDVYEQVMQEVPHPATITALEGLVMDEERRLRITQILDPVYRTTDEWRKLVAIWEAQLALQDDVSEKVRILGDIGRAHEDRGDDPVRALEAWSRAFVLDPASEDARREVDRLAQASKSNAQLVDVYERAIAAADASTKSDLLRALAALHDVKLGDPRAAIAVHERILAADEQDETALSALEGLHTLVGDWTGLVRVLEQKATQVYDAVDKAELLRRIGGVHEELLVDVEKAVDAFRRAHEEDSNDPIALESLDRLLGESGDHAALADVLEKRLDAETDDDVRKEVALRLADVSEQKLDAKERAIAALLRVRSTHPDDATMLEGLCRLYAATAQWPDVLDVLRARIDLASDAGKPALLVQVGDVLEKHLDDLHEAIETHQKALALDPGFAPSIEALLRIAKHESHRDRIGEIVEPLLRSQSRWDDMAALLELRADAASDALDKRDRLRELAKVHEDGRGDREKAFDAIRRALEQDATDLSVADEAERLGAAVEQYGALADTLQGRAAAAHDSELAKNLYLRVARLAEEKLADDPRAIVANEKALEQVGDDDAILASLDRLYGRTEQAPDLARVLERRIGMATDASARNGLQVRLGVLRREKFEDPRGAFAVFQEVLESDAANADAIKALEDLATDGDLASDVIETLEAAHRKTGAVDRLPSLYDIRLARAESVGEKVKVLMDRAALEEGQLGNKTAALESMVRALELDPRDAHLVGEVERLAGETGAWDKLRGVPERILEREQSDRTLAHDFGLRAAGYYLDKIADKAAGEVCLRAALAADVGSREANDRLTQLLRGEGRSADLAQALLAWAAADDDTQSKRERLREAATLAEGTLDDVALASKAFGAWVAADGTDPAALAGLCRVRAKEGNHGDVAELLGRRIDVESDASARLALRRELAELYAGALADVKRATAAYEAVLADAPTDLDTVGKLEGLYEQQKSWEPLRGLISKRFELASNDGERIAAKVRLARLEEQAFGRRAAAIEQLEEILKLDARHPEALDELERLLTAEKKWDELAARIDARAGMAEGEAAIAHLERLATLHKTERKSVADAAATYERIVGIDARNESALRTLVELHKGAKNDAEMASALERLVGILSGEAAITAAHQLAELCEKGLADVSRAESALRKALAVDPAHEPSRAGLKALFERNQKHAELAAVLAEEAEALTDDAKKVDAFKAISALYAQKLSDAAQAAVFLERASKLRPDDRDLLLPLCDLYVQAGRGGEAVPVLRQIIASFGGKKSKELAGFHHRLAQALESAGDDAAALEQLDAAFKIDLTSIPVLRDLGKLTYRMGDYERSQKTFRALLLQKLAPDAGVTKGDVYYYLGDMTAKTGDKAKAISMLERAVAEDKGHPKASELIAQLKG